MALSAGLVIYVISSNLNKSYLLQSIRAAQFSETCMRGPFFIRVCHYLNWCAKSRKQHALLCSLRYFVLKKDQPTGKKLVTFSTLIHPTSSFSSLQSIKRKYCHNHPMFPWVQVQGGRGSRGPQTSGFEQKIESLSFGFVMIENLYYKEMINSWFVFRFIISDYGFNQVQSSTICYIGCHFINV